MLLRTLASRSTIARRALATAKPPDPKPHTMAAVGATAGTLGSLAGMGGGFVAIPLMTRLGVSQHTAHGTSLVGVVCRDSVNCPDRATFRDPDVVAIAQTNSAADAAADGLSDACTVGPADSPAAPATDAHAADAALAAAASLEEASRATHANTAPCGSRILANVEGSDSSSGLAS